METFGSASGITRKPRPGAQGGDVPPAVSQLGGKTPSPPTRPSSLPGCLRRGIAHIWQLRSHIWNAKARSQMSLRPGKSKNPKGGATAPAAQTAAVQLRERSLGHERRRPRFWRFFGGGRGAGATLGVFGTGWRERLDTGGAGRREDRAPPSHRAPPPLRLHGVLHHTSPRGEGRNGWAHFLWRGVR